MEHKLSLLILSSAGNLKIRKRSLFLYLFADCTDISIQDCIGSKSYVLAALLCVPELYMQCIEIHWFEEAFWKGPFMSQKKCIPIFPNYAQLTIISNWQDCQ